MGDDSPTRTSSTILFAHGHQPQDRREDGIDAARSVGADPLRGHDLDLLLDDLNIDQTFTELQWGSALSIDRLTNELATHLNVPAEKIFDTVCTIPSTLVHLQEIGIVTCRERV